MASTVFRTFDGNEAAASVAHRVSEVIAIYPITPSSNMGELADELSAKGKTNLWGKVPTVTEMQSEGGAAGAVHGALMAGSLCTTFTCSQGLLLMIPNMLKIAGELTPAVFHVSARALATHALSIFGDHSDVMSVRSCGWAMLASTNVQEAQDMAAVAHSATLTARLPFLHFFDGFRTSHEVSKIALLGDDALRGMINEDEIRAHRSRKLNPDAPVIRGTAQNPDVFFQAREACNPYYDACSGIVAKALDKFAELTGRRYHLFDYIGAPDAERIVVVMGSGAETCAETAKVLAAKGEKVGVVNVRLYRPWDVNAFAKALPASVKSIAVLDRTKEPGASGEPLYQDVITALVEADRGGIKVVGGRYGLSSKEFTPAMVKAVFDNLSAAKPKNHFTVGINDDVGHTSLTYDAAFNLTHASETRCLFLGLGSDGTVGANKNSIKIIGEETTNWAQGYFVYDSKKSGSMTVSHLRFGPDPVRAPYLIGDNQAQFVAVHFQRLMDRLDILEAAAPGAVFLLNSAAPADQVWNTLTKATQKQIIAKQLKFYTIDAGKVAAENGMGNRINTVMQTCFFAISGILPKDVAISKIKKAIEKTYSKRGQAVVEKNFKAVDASLADLHQVVIPATVTSTIGMLDAVPANAPDFVRNVLGKMIAAQGDSLPVSALPADGTFPTGTTQWEKRALAEIIPEWDSATCIQCGKCTFVCPHGCLRAKVFDEGTAPGVKSSKASGKDFAGKSFTIQVSPDDCTGCSLCVEACPAKNKSQVGRKAINMESYAKNGEAEKQAWTAFEAIPDADRSTIATNTVKGSQLLRPLFEFSGACAGCGETPYVKLLSQLFGDRLVIANATGCSSIYGGNLPTTPYTKDANGRGPAWANSLFEDNAEFGLGMRLSIDAQEDEATILLKKLESQLAGVPVGEILAADQKDELGIATQRIRVAQLKGALAKLDSSDARRLLDVADTLVERSVWILGGDGWAYDIGYGGLDHVLASGEKVRVLVMDTEVYSNTGGQASKSTPRSAVAKFAAKGKSVPKKDLGLMAMAYGYVYVAKIAMGSSDIQTLKAFQEAEAHDGPSIIIAYSHCIAHGIDMRKGLEQQKNAVACGHWPLYRFNPALDNPMQIDSKEPSISFDQYASAEGRYRVLMQSDQVRGEALQAQAKGDLLDRLASTKRMALGQTPAQAAIPTQGSPSPKA